MRINRRLVLIISVSMAFVRVYASDRSPCHESPKYLVIERDTSSVGTDFLIKYKSKIAKGTPCKYVVEKNDFEIKNEWAEYFLALQDDFLILDSGTGPEPRGLIIWNLKKHKKMYSGTYSEPYKIKPGYLIFWKETGIANEKNCPDIKKLSAEGIGAAIETLVTLNLSDFSVINSTQTRCRGRQ